MTHESTVGELPATTEPATRQRSSALFRKEALAYHSRPLEAGEALHVLGAWAELYYWALLLLVIGGLALSYVVHVGSDRLLVVLVPPLQTLLEYLHG